MDRRLNLTLSANVEGGYDPVRSGSYALLEVAPLDGDAFCNWQESRAFALFDLLDQLRHNLENIADKSPHLHPRILPCRIALYAVIVLVLMAHGF